MKIKSISLKDFKRFTDLRIQEIPEQAKLVILTGPNGVGKSSLFEAFNVYLTRTKDSTAFDATYHLKSHDPLSGKSRPPLPTGWDTLLRSIEINFHEVPPFDPVYLNEAQFQKIFYIRSSYRMEPDFQISTLQRGGNMLQDDRRPAMLLSLDSRVSDNYQRIVATAASEVFDPNKAKQTAEQISGRLIGEACESLARVLPGLNLEGPGDPFNEGTFMFGKGSTSNWRYKNLSGGEKAAFDLILDFIVKKERFDDTVFCIDEPEAHMNTGVQGALLRELVSKLPEKCQLWVATHSAGMMRAAKDIAEQDPGTVSFLDFGGKDFDQAVVMTPESPTRDFWKRQFAVAIGDLAELLAPEQIVFCEGSMTGPKNPKFDARCYRIIFGAEFTSTEFVSLGSANDVERNAAIVGSVVDELFVGVRHFHLYDRDDRSIDEINEIKRGGGRVLSLRDLESYLYDDEVLAALCATHGHADKTEQMLAIKQDALARAVARDNPLDDVKSASGEIYTNAKKLLGLTQCGNDPNAFAISTLAPLIIPGTAIYSRLRADIFDV